MFQKWFWFFFFFFLENISNVANKKLFTKLFFGKQCLLKVSKELFKKKKFRNITNNMSDFFFVAKKWLTLLQRLMWKKKRDNT